MYDILQYQILRCLFWNMSIQIYLSAAIWNLQILFNFTTHFSQSTSVLYLTVPSQNCILSHTASEAISALPYWVWETGCLQDSKFSAGDIRVFLGWCLSWVTSVLMRSTADNRDVFTLQVNGFTHLVRIAPELSKPHGLCWKEAEWMTLAILISKLPSKRSYLSYMQSNWPKF